METTVTIFDFSAEPFDEHKLITAVRLVDAVGITVLSSSFNKVKSLISLIKQQNPDISRNLIGGPHCSLLPEKALEETQADICVQGDGEAVITDIKQALNTKKDFSEIPGVVYRTTTGIKHGSPPQLIHDLNSIPFPARHLVKHYVYGREYNPHLKAGEFTSIITSRGCPYTCRFCSRGAINMQRYRMRSTKILLLNSKKSNSRDIDMLHSQMIVSQRTRNKHMNYSMQSLTRILT